MNPVPATVLESAPVTVGRSEYDQIRSMAEVSGKGQRLFLLSGSPSRQTFELVGHVGQIFFDDGTSMSVLPDMPLAGRVRSPSYMLTEMLYRVFGMNPDRRSVSLFEFFVRVFADNVDRLIVRGLRSKYHSVSGNEKSFKGRIVFNEHIRRNYIHKERIFVEYETYSQNRPENRLIKSTVEALLRRTTDSRNSRELKTLLMAMEEIPESPDIDRDFEMCVSDRNMADYDVPMMWCNIFLKGMRMAGSSGGRFCYALAVRTDSLLGAYVARMSSASRADGSYQMKYTAEARTSGGTGGASVITVDFDWNFYDRTRNAVVRDAASLYLSAPGYRPIPHGVGDKVRAMAGVYLSDVFV